MRIIKTYTQLWYHYKNFDKVFHKIEITGLNKNLDKISEHFCLQILHMKYKENQLNLNKMIKTFKTSFCQPYITYLIHIESKLETFIYQIGKFEVRHVQHPQKNWAHFIFNLELILYVQFLIVHLIQLFVVNDFNFYMIKHLHQYVRHSMMFCDIFHVMKHAWPQIFAHVFMINQINTRPMGFKCFNVLVVTNFLIHSICWKYE